MSESTASRFQFGLKSVLLFMVAVAVAFAAWSPFALLIMIAVVRPLLLIRYAPSWGEPIVRSCPACGVERPSLHSYCPHCGDDV